MTTPLFMTLLFVVSAVVGYLLIRHVPSLLHTPLMSGMNALSGITLIGGLAAAAGLGVSDTVLKILGIVAIVFATFNVVGGFGVTDRMLAMFKGGKGGEK